MKDARQLVRVGDVCAVIAGQSPEGKFYNTEGMGIAFYQGKKDFGERFLRAPTTWTTQTTKIARQGDVLMSVRAPVGPVNIATDEICIGRGLAAIRSGPRVNGEFLFYQLLHLEPKIAGKDGAVFASINKSAIESLVLSLPPLAEQRRLVALLDEAFAGLATARANAEKNVDNARALFETHVQSVFEKCGEKWAAKTLGEVAQVKGGKRVPKGFKLQTEPTEYPYLRVTEFGDSGTIDTSGLRYVSRKVHQEIKNYIIRSADLYVSIAGTIGRCGIIPEELDGALLTENACRLVFGSGVSNRFVYYFTITGDFVAQVGLNTRTAAQPKLALSRLSTIKLPVPPLAEQEKLADRFDALREATKGLAVIYERKVAALEALERSLLHEAFSGELH